jgi:hypothetical protein
MQLLTQHVSPKDRELTEWLDSMVKLSFWLVPCAHDFAILHQWIQRLSDRYQTHPFVPHLTLGSGTLPWAIADFATHLQPLTQALTPLTLPTGPLTAGDRFSQTLFIPLPLTDGLQTILTRLRQQVPTPLTDCPLPHISLLYKTGGDLSEVLADPTPPLPQVTFDALWAVATPPQFETQADVQQLRCLYSSGGVKR